MKGGLANTSPTLRAVRHVLELRQHLWSRRRRWQDAPSPPGAAGASARGDPIALLTTALTRPAAQRPPEAPHGASRSRR